MSGRTQTCHLSVRQGTACELLYAHMVEQPYGCAICCDRLVHSSKDGKGRVRLRRCNGT